MNFPTAQSDLGDAKIDMTPMIDVVFLLVIFWLAVTAVSSPTMDSSVLPPASRLAQRSLAAQRVVLQVRPGAGAVYDFRSRLYDLAGIARRLETLAAGGAGRELGRPVLIRVDGMADSRNVAALLAVLRDLGVRRVDFAARIE
jgi:biopolymer transport protein ExbD